VISDITSKITFLLNFFFCPILFIRKGNQNPSINGGPFLFQDAGLEYLNDCHDNNVQLVQMFLL
jgi:hypothetical protein